MARLTAEIRSSWKAALRDCRAPWVIFGVNAEGKSLAEKLNGMAGLIDWLVHGQISRALIRGRVGANEFCLIPGAESRPSFLLYHFDTSPDAKSFLAKIRALNVKSLCLAESTFPEDFSTRVKQTLSKEGISCITLEP